MHDVAHSKRPQYKSPQGATTVRFTVATANSLEYTGSNTRKPGLPGSLLYQRDRSRGNLLASIT